VANRRQVEKLNANLEERVASQVEEITKHTKEIVQLNEQLNQQVKERSRELSMALARLAEDHQALAPGAVLGDRVEIEARIGEGGMGAVYRGRDLVTSGAVAVKVVQAGSANELDGLYRFLREAQALASLAHPAIVRSFHVDVADDGRLFQIMELVSGETLQAWLDREGPLRAPVAARLGAVLADALANAHAAGVVHRDVKPANVMLTSESPGLKLLDFGVSKLRDARAAHGRTTGNVIGTPEFLSPEQIGDPENVGDRADVYALGLVLYLALSGRPPYDTVSARSWLVAHVVQPPERITAVVKGIDPDVGSIVMGCLRKVPEERPSATDVARSLAACADRLGCAALESLWRPGSRPPERPSPEPPITGVQRAETPSRRTLKVVR
jgi:serine/threonine-protein kinase